MQVVIAKEHLYVHSIAVSKLNALKGKEVVILPHRQLELGANLLAQVSVQKEILQARSVCGPLFSLPPVQKIWEFTTLRCMEVLKHQHLLVDVTLEFKKVNHQQQQGFVANISFKMKVDAKDVMLVNRDS